MLFWFVRWLTTFLPRRLIRRDGKPYLRRFFVFGRDGKQRAWGWLALCPLNLFVHEFLDSDTPGKVHSHPYPFSLSWILDGWYTEERTREAAPGLFTGLETRIRRAGRFNWIGPGDYHRVWLEPGVRCWTLFLSVNHWKRQWFFLDLITKERTLASGRT